MSPPASGVPVPGAVGRIEHVDVDRDVEGGVADPLPHPLDHARDAQLLEVHGGHDPEAEAGVVDEVLRREQGAADAHVHGVVLEQQALLEGAAEGRAVGVGGAEVGVPGVEVRVEVQEGGRPVALVDGPQQGQRDRVVAADGDEVLRPRSAARAPPPRSARIASGMSNGVHAMSPASTTCWAAKGWTSRTGVVRRSSRDAWRTAIGPKRAPGRKVTPLSKGTPTTATSQRADLVEAGQAREGRGPGEARHLEGVHRALDLARPLGVVTLLAHPSLLRVGRSVPCPRLQGQSQQHPGAEAQDLRPSEVAGHER